MYQKTLKKEITTSKYLIYHIGRSLPFFDGCCCLCEEGDQCLRREKDECLIICFGFCGFYLQLSVDKTTKNKTSRRISTLINDKENCEAVIKLVKMAPFFFFAIAYDKHKFNVPVGHLLLLVFWIISCLTCRVILHGLNSFNIQL